MGNYKFRLSDMMPNAWFYKLKDMSTKPRNHTTSNNKKHISSSKPKPTPHQHFIQHRNSYYIQTNEAYISSDKLYNSPINPKVSDVHFPDQPTKSSKRKSRRRPNTKLVSSSVSAGCICRATMDSVSAKTDSISTPDSSTPTSPENTLHESSIPESGSDPVSSSLSSSCSCKMTSSPTHIIIDVNETNKASSYKFDGLESISELELPPILTKPAKFNYAIAGIKNREAEQEEETFRVRRSCSKLEEKIVRVVKEECVKPRKQNRTSPRCSATSPGLKLRGNSPKIASKKIQAYSRKSTVSSTTKTGQVLSRRKRVAESFAIVKSSFDPQRDFRESMVEMIVENNIRASKDLEELLACYLSLNSNEYHDLIVKVFEQIWFDLTAIHL